MEPSMPPADAPLTRWAAWVLDVQARACRVLGSPLYAHLLARASRDAAAGGPTWEVMAPHLDRRRLAEDARSAALALRLLAAVHRLVLVGGAAELARHYPSVGGDGDPEAAWQAFHHLLARRQAELGPLVGAPCQTNEVGRCAGLACGFLSVAARTGLPLRLLEVGASAGLNLRWDRYRYTGGGAAWGPDDAPVRLDGMWTDPPPHTDVTVRVAERRGCDPSPVDPASDEGRLRLTAAVWADQVDRLERLRGALDVAAAVPATVDRASVERWLPARLAAATPGVVRVVYHSVVDEYLGSTVRQAFHGTLREAGASATARAPLAWLRLEPVSALRRHGVTLTTWPGGAQRLLAGCGAHGQDVRWVADELR